MTRELAAAADDLARAQDRLREAREALWGGLIDRPAFEGVLRRYERARAIAAKAEAEARERQEAAA